MTNQLLPALRDSAAWAARFTYQEYFQAFREYTERFAPVCMETLRGADDAALLTLAEELLDTLAAHWAAQRIWNRSKARFCDKQLIVGFFNPMLLGLEEPACSRLAEVMQERWAARWPKDAYQLADYQTIRSGFRNVVLGFELPDKRLEEESQVKIEKNKEAE